jgi:predicted nucleic acid-binding Zn ribbon protein
MRSNGIPETKRDRIARLAYRARFVSEWIRVDTVQGDRSKALVGYSPFVHCSSSSWSQSDGFKGGPILWRQTLQAAAAYGTASEIAPIRVPGFILRGEQVVPTRTLRPTEYTQLWKERNLDAYLECVSEMLGERRCLNCFAALPATAGQHQRFCSERCRNAAKQRRYRERNPEAVQRAQQRYWQSLDG